MQSAASPVAAVGILMLETRFPRILGDVGNAATWPFPVHYRVVPGASPERVVRERAAGLLQPFIDAGRELLAEGADGITTSCGFLSLFQAELAAALNAPVATSSLMQAPMIERLLPAGKRVGILTITAEALTAEHLSAAGADPDTPVTGMDPSGAFASAILNDAATLDIEAARREHLAAARSLLDSHPDVGAILLECTNMGPYAADLREEFGLPVYSIYSFIQWFHAGLTPRRFAAEADDAV